MGAGPQGLALPRGSTARPALVPPEMVQLRTVAVGRPPRLRPALPTPSPHTAIPTDARGPCWRPLPAEPQTRAPNCPSTRSADVPPSEGPNRLRCFLPRPHPPLPGRPRVRGAMGHQPTQPGPPPRTRFASTFCRGHVKTPSLAGHVPSPTRLFAPATPSCILAASRSRHDSCSNCKQAHGTCLLKHPPWLPSALRVNKT